MNNVSDLIGEPPATVFTEAKFWLLVMFSLVVPLLIYGGLLAMRALSRRTILLLGFILVGIAGLDVYLLRSLAAMAKQTASVADDKIFDSEVSLALYFLPVLFGGIGINIVSNVLAYHLERAQQRFREKHSSPSPENR